MNLTDAEMRAIVRLGRMAAGRDGLHRRGGLGGHRRASRRPDALRMDPPGHPRGPDEGGRRMTPEDERCVWCGKSNDGASDGLCVECGSSARAWGLEAGR